jgi:hypothetical protein
VTDRLGDGQPQPTVIGGAAQGYQKDMRSLVLASLLHGPAEFALMLQPIAAAEASCRWRCSFDAWSEPGGHRQVDETDRR